MKILRICESMLLVILRRLTLIEFQQNTQLRISVDSFRLILDIDLIVRTSNFYQILSFVFGIENF